MHLRFLAVLAALATAPLLAATGEGMWLPGQMQELAEELRQAGYEGDPTALTDLTRAPMSAVVQVGGATGSFVSSDGLVLTNHHVAYGVIQYNSHAGRNLLREGFVAATRADEVPANPDFRIRVTVGFDRVSERVLATAAGRTGRAYADAIDMAGKALVADCEADADLVCSVVNLHYGSDFYLVRQLELRDIRLVYAPPEAIGSYGDEIDNFEWPRHSGDFTLLRAYVGPDGKPADHAADNVPYRPDGHFQVSTRALREGDFAMLAGYPGVTFRHRSASEFAEIVDWRLPTRAALYRSMIDTIETASAADDAAAVRYAAQLNSLRNTLKRARGEREGLQRSAAAAVRAQQETDLRAWLAAAGPSAPASSADLDAVEAVLAEGRTRRDHDQVFMLMRTQPQLLRAALTIQRAVLERSKPDAQREPGYQERDQARLRDQLRQVQRRFDARVEKALLADLLDHYRALPGAQQAPELLKVLGTSPDDTRARLEKLYAGTGLGNEAARLRWFDTTPEALARTRDPLLKTAARLLPVILEDEARLKAYDGELLRLRPAVMRAWITWAASQGRPIYPDANRTVRIAFGRIVDLKPRDAVRHAPFTTVTGILEKHTGEDPFDAPQPLLDAIARGDFGSTADPKLGTQTVNFLANLDTTGGNSGSPILDARGELIGIHFDSNWEAVSASWKFDPRYKRSIEVDARYIRWLLAKVYPAPHLLEEMGLPAQ